MSSNSKIKLCSRCGAAFSCGATEVSGNCWCNQYPPLIIPDPLINCMCPSCLHKAIKRKINDYVAGMTTKNMLNNNKAKLLPKTRLYIEGIDYYTENSLRVFTAWHHLKRGHCCQSGCRHCPYGFKKDKA